MKNLSDIQSVQSKDLQFQDLMLHRVHEILMVASPYDSFILEEDGRLTEQILHEYLGMNLSYAPRVWRAATAGIALELLSKRPYDLVIVMLRISDMNPISFGKKVKELYPNSPSFYWLLMNLKSNNFQNITMIQLIVFLCGQVIQVSSLPL